jgi:hypothetical protein
MLFDARPQLAAREQRFVQYGYGCLVSPHVLGGGGFHGGCDRWKLTTVRIPTVDGRNITLANYQPASPHAIKRAGCTPPSTAAVDELLASGRIDAAYVQGAPLGATCEADAHEYEGFARRLTSRQPAVPTVRAGPIAWSPWSLAAGHCVSLQRADALEDALRGAVGTAEPLPLLRATKPLALVQSSSGVHATASTNAVLAHLVATHLSAAVGPE